MSPDKLTTLSFSCLSNASPHTQIRLITKRTVNFDDTTSWDCKHGLTWWISLDCIFLDHINLRTLNFFNSTCLFRWLPVKSIKNSRGLSIEKSHHIFLRWKINFWVRDLIEPILSFKIKHTWTFTINSHIIVRKGHKSSTYWLKLL